MTTRNTEQARQVDLQATHEKPAGLNTPRASAVLEPTRRSFLAAAICLPFTGLRRNRCVWDVVDEAQRRYGIETGLQPINPRIARDLAGCCYPSSGFSCFKHCALTSFGDIMDICNVIVHATGGDIQVCVHKMRSSGFQWDDATIRILGEIASNEGADMLWAWHGNFHWQDLGRIGIRTNKSSGTDKQFSKTLWAHSACPCTHGTPNCLYHLHSAPGEYFCIAYDLVPGDDGFDETINISFHQAPNIAGPSQVPPSPG